MPRINGPYRSFWCFEMGVKWFSSSKASKRGDRCSMGTSSTLLTYVRIVKSTAPLCGSRKSTWRSTRTYSECGKVPRQEELEFVVLPLLSLLQPLLLLSLLLLRMSDSLLLRLLELLLELLPSGQSIEVGGAGMCKEGRSQKVKLYRTLAA